MKKLIILATFCSLFSVSVLAQNAFVQTSSEKKTVTGADLSNLEKAQTAGTKSGTNLTFTAPEISLVVITGPDDDMLSYRIQDMRNPTLVVPSGATIRIVFVNVDDDMKHDFRIGQVMGDFVSLPDIKESVGTDRLDSHDENVPMQAEAVVLKIGGDGAYKYFCSVRGHAKGGMWGNLLVGVKPGSKLKLPVKPKTPSGSGDKMENMPGMKTDDKETAKKPDEMSKMPGMKPGAKSNGMAGMMDNAHAMEMKSTTNIGDPMARESSGTSWAPDSSPMYARSKMFESGGMLMFMGTGFVRYTHVGSSRDVSVAGKGSRSRADAPSMFMGMLSKPIGSRAQIGFHVMMSLDPIFQRGWGYPLLYQTGEQYHGLPIHDRQHAHDLFSELAISYSYKLDEKRSFYLYAGYPGEPALGPPMYLHRTSGSNIPDAPIGHHWQDATHITFGVVTAGLSFGKAKIEASAFNGREPNENRWNFDRPRLNSFSGRLSWNPTKDWAFQISHGYIRSPEPAEPDVRVLRRTAASAIYNKKFDENRNWGNSIVWGQNYANRERANSILFESNYDFYGNSVFGRAEAVQKSGRDLVLAPALAGTLFWVRLVSVGYVRDIVKDHGFDLGIGGMVTLDMNPDSLTSYYGGTTHGGWEIFMRVRPSKMGH